MSVRVQDTLKPKNDADFPVLADGDLQGGHQTVADSTARDAITVAHRSIGMFVTTQDDGQVWQLGNDLTTWTAFGGGGGANVPQDGTTQTGTDACAIGFQCDATGDYSFAVGSQNQSTSEAATAFGESNTASGVASFTAGSGSTSSGQDSVAIGQFCTASGFGAVSLGGPGTASGAYATVVGSQNNAGANYALALGLQNTASGVASLAVGYLCTANVDYSIAAGQSCQALGISSIAMGDSNTASGAKSVAMGYSCSASGSYSIAMGYGCVASNTWAIAMGVSNVASATGAVALGFTNTASGIVSFATGHGATSTRYGQRSHSASASVAVPRAQTSYVELWGFTTGLSPTQSMTLILLDNSQFVLDINRAYSFQVRVTVCKDDGSQSHTFIQRANVRTNGSGVPTLTGVNTQEDFGDSVTWTVVLGVSSSPNLFNVTVSTGVGTTAALWMEARVEFEELRFA